MPAADPARPRRPRGLRRCPAWLATLVALLPAACGGTGAATGNGGAATGGRSAVAASTGLEESFPRVVAHELGTTRIPARPRRVVAVTDGAELASLLALGVRPVGFGQRNEPLRPWIASAGGNRVARYRIAGSEVSFERMVAWRPDLLLVQVGFATRENLGQFTAIAPTVVTSFVDWRESLREVAEATGTTGRAKELVAANEAAIAATRLALSDKKGLKVEAISVFEGPQVYRLNSASPLGKLAPAVGLAPFPEQESPGEAVETLPLEKLPDIDADVLILQRFSGNEDGDAVHRSLQQRAIWKRIPAVAAGRVVELNEDEADASYFDSVLTVPLNLRMLRDRLG